MVVWGFGVGVSYWVCGVGGFQLIGFGACGVGPSTFFMLGISI